VVNGYFDFSLRGQSREQRRGCDDESLIFHVILSVRFEFSRFLRSAHPVVESKTPVWKSAWRLSIWMWPRNE
jgi:hypothetical protein